ncbi:Fc.00g113390.m01.CDS01 [Cosmosporella sp. VM-42]
MPPQTRSRGVAPPSRVYHSTPNAQQAQFPARRKVVRTYGKQTRKPAARALRQQTLTQIDFVSSFEEDKDPIVLSSDSEDMGDDDDEEENKENTPVKKGNIRTKKGGEGDDDDQEEPVSSGRKRRATSKKATTKKDRAKRRRTLADESDSRKTKESKSSRRKTLGDPPASSSSYHTQTLTQFLGRDKAQAQCIRDSEDEDDDGFQDWLQDPASPSPRRTLRASRSPLKPVDEARQESVVPQTPAKRTRDEIPSSNQTTPLSTMVDRYGPPNVPGPSPLKSKSSPPDAVQSTPSQAEVPSSSPLSTLRSTLIDRYGPPNILDPSPSQKKSSPTTDGATPVQLQLTGKPKAKAKSSTPKLVIEDTFGTSSWGSGGTTPRPLRNLPVTVTTPQAKTPSGESSSLPDQDDMETPTKPRRRRESAELGDRKKTKTPSPRKMKRVSPYKGKKVVLEIPDSDEDDEGFEGFSDDDENNDEGTYVAGPETQFVMNEIASSEEHSTKATPASTAPAIQDARTSSAVSAKTLHHSTSLPAVPSSQPTTPGVLSTPSKPTRDPRERLRKPLHHPIHVGTHTQPLESQRVPVAILQALPAPSARTDILLPLAEDVLSSVTGGYQVNLVLPFKIPAQVVRFWLFNGDRLRYMACAEPGERDKGAWRYCLSQVYELNNPVKGEDMREEEWIEGEIGRYAYFPPAVVGQLLWNLRHPIFGDGSEDEDEDGEDKENEVPCPNLPVSASQRKNPTPTPTPNLSVSQQVEAQLQSDITHSTQFPTSDDILVPSTPEAETQALPPPPRPSSTIKPPPPHLTHPPTSYRASRQSTAHASTIRPSQATTASQASTPEKSYHRPLPPAYSSSSILTFQDVGDSSPLRLPQSVQLGSSQLLTKSQMLPDSLLRDDGRVPPEIWDSDEDEDTAL